MTQRACVNVLLCMIPLCRYGDRSNSLPTSLQRGCRAGQMVLSRRGACAQPSTPVNVCVRAQEECVFIYM